MSRTLENLCREILYSIYIILVSSDVSDETAFPELHGGLEFGNGGWEVLGQAVSAESGQRSRSPSKSLNPASL